MTAGTRDWLRVAAAMFGVAWGANQFAPLLLVYRAAEHVSDDAFTAMFGVYALGLIPALLLAGPTARRYGTRAVLRLTMVLSVIGSLVLIAGAVRPELLYLGRLLAGVASGLVLTAGTAEVKELSARAPDGAGARRAAIALSAGFGGAPLVAGAVAQWLPAPDVLPYLVHLGLMLVIVPALWAIPDRPGTAGGGERSRPRLLPATAGNRRFSFAVTVWAPWVFATASIGVVTLCSLVAAHTHRAPVAFNGAIAGLTLLTGILIQPLARRLRNRRDGIPPVAGMLTAAAGLCLAAATAATRSPLLVPPTALLLGAAYGILLVSGLQEIQQLARPGELTALLAIFYALTYVGFAAPYLLTALAARLGYPRCLLAAAALTLVSLAPIVAVLHSNPVTEPRQQPDPVTPQ